MKNYIQLNSNILCITARGGGGGTRTAGRRWRGANTAGGIHYVDVAMLKNRGRRASSGARSSRRKYGRMADEFLNPH